MAGQDWIAADWGTSHLRIWHMSAEGTVKSRHTSDQGMGTLNRDGFEPALLAALPDLPGTTTVMICGMAGSRQGWCEAPYAAVPCTPPSGSDAVRVPGTDTHIDARILPGIKQDSPADVMRGEETQVAGFLALNPGFDGVICLPGTHSKWVHISAGEVVSFRTFVTGELFALLSKKSVLRHSIGTEGWDDAAFAEALDQAMGRPAAFAADLFSLRAENLLHDLSPAAARARLSGLLIGMELAAAKPYWLGQSVAVLGETGLARVYTAALEKQGLPVTRADAERMTLEGLKAAYAQIKETA